MTMGSLYGPIPTLVIAATETMYIVFSFTGAITACVLVVLISKGRSVLPYPLTLILYPMMFPFCTSKCGSVQFSLNDDLVMSNDISFSGGPLGTVNQTCITILISIYTGFNFLLGACKISAQSFFL